MSKTNDQARLGAASLLAGFAAIGVTWHFGARYLIAPEYRLNMAAVVQEIIHNPSDGGGYLASLWAPMRVDGYPFAFTMAVLPAVLLFGAVIGIRSETWFNSMMQAIGGWLGGAFLGMALTMWVTMPNPWLGVLAMPGSAFLLGGLVPMILAPVRGLSIMRGTRIVRHRANSVRALERAKTHRRTTLAGVMLDRRAEVRHLAAMGVTGSGKSTALRGLMHTALHRGDRHIVADPDGSAMSLFHRDGDVILNPFDARSGKWDILAEIHEHTDYRFLSESVLPSAPGQQGDEWIKYAREIFTACLRSWHVNRLGTSDAFFAAIAMSDREALAVLCEGTAAHRYFEAGNERMLGSILGTMGPALESMRQLAQVKGPPFSVRRWLREEAGSLWMPYQAQQIPALRGLVSCWMGLAISETLSLPDSEERRIWFHIDELDALGRIQNLKDAQTRVRKKGGCVVMGFQSIAQVRAVYGEAEAHTIVENCDNKLILRCGASENGGTARFASDLIGEREIERDETTNSYTEGAGGKSSISKSVRRQVEKAVLPSEITRLPDCAGYLKVATQPDWSKVSFKPVAFPARIGAYVPIEPLMQEVAD